MPESWVRVERPPGISKWLPFAAQEMDTNERLSIVNGGGLPPSGPASGCLSCRLPPTGVCYISPVALYHLTPSWWRTGFRPAAFSHIFAQPGHSMRKRGGAKTKTWAGRVEGTKKLIYGPYANESQVWARIPNEGVDLQVHTNECKWQLVFVSPKPPRPIVWSGR